MAGAFLTSAFLVTAGFAGDTAGFAGGAAGFAGASQKCAMAEGMSVHLKCSARNDSYILTIWAIVEVSLAASVFVLL